MSRIIACAICGVEQGPEVIEGCYANAKKHGLENSIINLCTLGGHSDYAHVWMEQPVVNRPGFKFIGQYVPSDVDPRID